MKIVQLTPGSGDTFYCENCLRDGQIARAWREMGHQCLMVPLYLPLSMGAGEGGAAPIFFGGLNVYLQQHSALFRRTPRWIDRLLDRPGLLRRLGRLAGMTSAADLGQTTLSMLDGRDGRQVKELDRLVGFLAVEGRPDVVVLSNALLLGLAAAIKQALGGAKIACLLQDEDEFVDALSEEYRRAVWDKLADRAGDADVFVAVSHYYAGRMRERLRLSPSRLAVVHVGVPVEEYAPAGAPPKRPVVGFLSRMCRSKGLDVLADAFVRLRADPLLAGVRLRAAGGKTAADDRFLSSVRRRLRGAGLAGDVELLPNLPGQQRRDFLRSLSVLSVPDRQGEAGGLFIVEALACGVPVLLPRTGVAPELLEATGGGALYEPNDAEALAAALREMLPDRDRLAELGRRGRAAVAEKFHVRAAAAGLAAAFASAGQ